MKRQIHPTIKAHLLRSGFYVLLLLAVCVIPFALAQRARPVAAGARVGQYSTGVLPGKPATVQSQFPSDAVALRASQFPTTSSGRSGLRSIGIPPMPKFPLVILYDQYDNATVTAPVDITSQDFEPASDPFDTQAADDFVVPAGDTWDISEVDVMGAYNGGPAESFHVYFYQDSGGLPGALVDSRLANPYTGGPPDFVITLTSPVTLTEGTYWVSVQSRQDSDPNGQWFWHNRDLQATAAAAWQNPGDGFGTGCTSWVTKILCAFLGQLAPDQVFRLVGTTGGATPTPTPTPSATPTVTPTPTPTATPSVSVTPSVTPTVTPSATPSATPTPSVTPSPTPTPSATPTVTPTPTATPGACVFGFGYWKNHPQAWPVTELQLGNVTYTQDQLLSIMHEPVHGNGLVSLAHHLITAKLNVANGADPSCIQQTIADADALIGDLVVPPVGDGFLAPRDVNALKDILEDYNEGHLCAPSCDNEGSPTPSPSPRIPRHPPTMPHHQRPPR